MTFSDESRSGRRMTGVRFDYRSAPRSIHAWVEKTLGAPVVAVTPRVGGMSPAVAVSLRGANGATAFVKAVGSTINPDTPGHFRHEVKVLQALPPAPYRADLRSTYDDGDWVGIALEDIDGRHPDWSSTRDRETVFAVVQQQTAELTPPPPRLPAESNRDALVKYLAAMRDATADELAGLPSWAAGELPALSRLTRQTIDHQRDECFCHWDIRHDNILIRHTDGQPLLLDWGMSRRGQRWADVMVFALEWVGSPEFDRVVAEVGLSAEEEEYVTGFLAGIGCYLTLTATHPAPFALPNLPAFRRQVGLACLEGVHRRIGR